MIWALLALLGIPIWFIAVVLLAAFRNRNHVRANPDIFEFKHKKGDGWQRGKSFARWVSDVMIVHSGIALIRVDAAQIEDVSVTHTLDPAPKGLGEQAHEVLIRYSAGKTISFAVSDEYLDAMLGPMKGPEGTH